MVNVLVKMDRCDYERIYDIARLITSNQKDITEQEIVNKVQEIISAKASGKFEKLLIEEYLSVKIENFNDGVIKLKDLLIEEDSTLETLDESLKVQELISLVKVIIDEISRHRINLKLKNNIKKLPKTIKGVLNLNFEIYKRPLKDKVSEVCIYVEKDGDGDILLDKGKIYYNDDKIKPALIDKDLDGIYASKSKLIKTFTKIYGIKKSQLIINGLDK